MDDIDPLQRAIEHVGLARVARECQVTHQAVRKWQAAGRMPRTEWTGETAYGEKIERLTNSMVTKAQLLEGWRKALPGVQEPSHAA